MEDTSDKIVDAIISNIEHVLDSLLTEIKELPEALKSDRSWIFLRHLMYLVEHVLTRLRITPDEEKSKRDYYWKLWHENRTTKEKLIELTNTIDKRRQTHQTLIAKIHSNYLRNWQLIQKIENKFTEDAEAIRLRFERTQYNEYKQFEEHKSDLNEICVISRNKSENFKAGMRKLETEMFHKKEKISSKYAELLERYDTEVGERLNTISNLKTILDDLNMKNRELENKIEEQSFLHDSCFTEQEECKLAEIKLKLEKITKTIAARKIQQWWRSILPDVRTRRKKAKKSKKSNKKSRKK